MNGLTDGQTIQTLDAPGRPFRPEAKLLGKALFLCIS